MQLYHLSHIDLDGYSAQIITQEYFKNARYYNSNYGDEILEKLKKIFYDIDNNPYDDNLVLITDLNLTTELANKLEKFKTNSTKRVEILLLDHHKTGEHQANLFDWYHLDISRCATKITYEYFKKTLGQKEHLETFVEVVNAIDIWLEDSEYFEIGKVMLKLVDEAKEINRTTFPVDNTKYIFSLLKSAMRYFNYNKANIVLDESLHKIKKNFFNQGEDNTLDNLTAQYMVDLMSSRADSMEIEYQGQKGILGYSIRGVSIIGNLFLKQNPSYKFFMNISPSKNISLRANGQIDVSELSANVFNGGGHANAAGGRFKEFKDSYVYQKIRSQVKEVLLRNS